MEKDLFPSTYGLDPKALQHLLQNSRETGTVPRLIKEDGSGGVICTIVPGSADKIITALSMAHSVLATDPTTRPEILVQIAEALAQLGVSSNELASMCSRTRR